MFEVKGLTKYFGGLGAVRNVDFTVERGQVVGLIGPNGAGKTTVFNLICGFDPPTAGEIIYRGEKITGLKPFEVCHRGIGRTFQVVRPLPMMTVLENAMVGAFCRVNTSSHARQIALEMLEFTGLMDRANSLALNLTIAQRKRLEVARALATKPDLLLFDEVMAGLNPTESDEAMKLIGRLKERGTTMIVVEHVMRVVMSISDKVVVLHHGEKIAEGTPSQVSQDQSVISAYLGASDA